MLAGPSGCGKTTTVTAVYDQLRKQGATSTCKKQEGGNPLDFSDILKYKGILISVLTMGDYSYRITDCMDWSAKNGCSFFVTACNDRFSKPFKKILQFAGSNIVRKSKTIPAQWQADIDKCANTILSYLP